MALTDLTRISTSGIATGTSLSGAILHGDAHFRGTNAGITSALFDSSDNALEFNDNVKLTFGNATNGDLRIYHDTSNGSYVREAGPGALRIQGDAGVWIQSSSDNQDRIVTNHNGDVQLFYSGNKKLNTTNHGVEVTGILTATSFSGPIVGNTNNTSGISTFYDLRVSNNLTVEGTTTTLDTNLIGVDRVEVGANSNTVTGIAVTQSGTADIVRLYDGSTQVVTVDDEGRVGIGSAIPAAKLDVSPTIQVKNTALNGVANVDINAANGGQARLNLYAGVSGGVNRAARIDFHNQGVAQWMLINDFSQNGTNQFSIRHDGEHAISCMPDGTVSLYDDGDESLRTDVAGILVPEKVIHLGDTNTYLQFTDDVINLTAGGTTGLSVQAASVRVPTKLGINGAAPQVPLDIIANGSGYAINVRGRSSDNLGEIRFTSNDYGSLYAQIVTGATYLNLSTGGSTRVNLTNDRFQILNRLLTSGDYNYLSGNSTTTATLTLKKTASGADSIDYLQLRNSSNALLFKISGDGILFTSDVLASHEGDTNTKIRFPANDTISFETAGSERLRIDSGGHFKVTNGNAANWNTLQRYATTLYCGVRIQDADATQRMQFGVAGGANQIVSGAAQHDVCLKAYDANLIFATNATERLRIDNAGRVKVGDNTRPASDSNEGAQLRVTGAPLTRNQYYSPAGDYYGSFGYTNNSNTKAWLAVDSSYAQSNAISAGIFLSAFHQDAGGSACGYTIKNLKSTNSLVFSSVKTAASVGNPAVEEERVRISHTGNVGINTDMSGGGGAYGRLSVVIPSQSGGSALQVMNSAVGSGDGSLTNIVLRSVNNAGTQWAGAEYRAQEHIFKNQATEALRIASNGNVAIGGDTNNVPRNLWLYNGSNDPYFRIQRGTTSDINLGGIEFASSNGNGNNMIGTIYGRATGNSATTGVMIFKARDSSSGSSTLHEPLRALGKSSSGCRLMSQGNAVCVFGRHHEAGGTDATGDAPTYNVVYEHSSSSYRTNGNGAFGGSFVVGGNASTWYPVWFSLPTHQDPQILSVHKYVHNYATWDGKLLFRASLQGTGYGAFAVQHRIHFFSYSYKQFVGKAYYTGHNNAFLVLWMLGGGRSYQWGTIGAVGITVNVGDDGNNHNLGPGNTSEGPITSAVTIPVGYEKNMNTSGTHQQTGFS